MDTPDGVTRVDVPTSMVWFICRPVLYGDDDLSNVSDLINRISILNIGENMNFDSSSIISNTNEFETLWETIKKGTSWGLWYCI